MFVLGDDFFKLEPVVLTGVGIIDEASDDDEERYVCDECIDSEAVEFEKEDETTAHDAEYSDSA